MNDHPSQPRLRVAFIGAGRMAREHLRALRHVPTPLTVSGVYDHAAHAAHDLALLAGATAYPSPAALFSAVRPDVVHVCPPAGAHFAPARQALLAGAHIYVEKPFVETSEECRALLELAAERKRLVAAGHQLMWVPAYQQLIRAAASLAPISFVDSYFAFNPPRLKLERAESHLLAEQLIDVLPHPLYTLLASLQQFGGAEPTMSTLFATPTEAHALLRVGEVTGRLFVSLRARPTASTLAVSGAGGTLTVDFVRSIVLGAANPGTTPIEKIANPLLEGWQLGWRTSVSLAKRLLGGGGYAGLRELLSEFYGAAATGRASPLSGAHLLQVTKWYERLSHEIRRTAAHRAGRGLDETADAGGAPIALVTGARGYLGKEIARELVRRGYRVRGISRSAGAVAPHVHEWVTTDLSEEVPTAALADVALVVHAAAETAGGYEAHQRNSINATWNLLRGMGAAAVRRLVYVSSISVLEPPRTAGERQDERTPLAQNAKRLGSYAWGKCVAEQVVAEEAPRLNIDTRIVRPAALVDHDHAELPGLLGRRVFGRWHAGLGRPATPIAVCEVGAAARVVAWCADHFAEAPAVVNLIDETITTRGQLLDVFRSRGWRGRMVWVPITLAATLYSGVAALVALARGQRPRYLAAWAILRPRRYNPSVASRLLAAAAQEEPRTVRPQRAAALSIVPSD